MRISSLFAVCALVLATATSAGAQCTPPQIRADIAAESRGRRLSWPPGDGITTAPETRILRTGTIIDRFGCDDGHHFSPRGTSFSSRSLPYDCDSSPYYAYRITRPLSVEAGTVAPWFNQNGGGTQYTTSESAHRLLSAGVLKQMKASRPACNE